MQAESGGSTPAPDITSEITHAITLSRREEWMTVGKAPTTVHGRFQVGYDVWKITGHRHVGEHVYLTLESAGWVRSLDLLRERTG